MINKISYATIPQCVTLMLFLFFMTSATAQIKTDTWLNNLLRKDASPLLLNVLNQPETYRYQLIYTKIERDEKNWPHFKNYYLNVDRNRYFNPASMVKMPVAFAALEKVNQLKGSINKHSVMFTDSARPGQLTVHKDETAANGMPSIDHYIKRIFLISDNDAYNRLYEFVGQKQLNESLWKKGYKDIRILRRFYTDVTLDENRHTNQIRFLKDGETIYTQPPAYNDVPFDFSKKVFIGKGHWNKNDTLINEPMDFTQHNNAPLEDLQQILQSVLFPQSVSAKKQFNLSDDDYRSLYKYMSQKPSESRYPTYDTTEYFDSYTKFFFFKDGKQQIPDYIRSFNKTGWSFGFLTDVCYIVDFKNNIEFMLSGNIYVNADGVLNDNKYEYEEIGFPFFREIGEKIYRYELQRPRKYHPKLNGWKFTYD